MDWETFWRRVDAILDLIIWVWDSLMLYICAVWLCPLALAAIVKLLTHEMPRVTPGRYFVIVLIVAPAWLVAAGYARFAGTPRAHRMQGWIDRAFWPIVCSACALMIVFALLKLAT